MKEILLHLNWYIQWCTFSIQVSFLHKLSHVKLCISSFPCNVTVMSLYTEKQQIFPAASQRQRTWAKRSRRFEHYIPQSDRDGVDKFFPFYDSDDIFYIISVQCTVFTSLILPHSKSGLSFSSTEEAYQSGQGVLVHCQAGVSRSATIVIAYLMKHTLMTMTDAYKYVRSRRPVVSPNLNFMGQLLEFERDLNSGVTPRILMPKLSGVETQVWGRSGAREILLVTKRLKQRWKSAADFRRVTWPQILWWENGGILGGRCTFNTVKHETKNQTTDRMLHHTTITQYTIPKVMCQYFVGT